MSLAAEHLVLVTMQHRLQEAEQYRLTHPERSPRPTRSRNRRPAWMHLPDLSGLLHSGRHTPRILG